MANSTIHSATSIEDATRILKDYADYRIQESTQRALVYISAIDFLLAFRPTRAVHGGRGAEEIAFDAENLRFLRKLAEDWVESQSTDQGVEYLDFSEYRS